MMNFVYTLCSSTPGQIQYGGFKRALAKKSGDMIRDRVRILYLLFLWVSRTFKDTLRFSTCTRDPRHLFTCAMHLATNLHQEFGG